MSDPTPDSEQLQQQVHATRLHFLVVELEVGNTMLDTAAASHDEEAKVRRRARAQEAHDEVERQLARADALGVTPAEREALTAGLARLGERIAAAGDAPPA